MIKLLEKYSKISWAFVVAIALIIFFISSLTFAPSKPFGFSKAVFYHFFAFFFLAFFLLPALVKGKKKNLIFIAIILAVLYGISDEIHQLFVPGRAFAISDILTDSAGIFLASFLYVLKLRRKQNRKNK